MAATSNKKTEKASRENRVDDDVNVLVFFIAGRKRRFEGVQAVADGINSLVHGAQNKRNEHSEDGDLDVKKGVANGAQALI